MRFADWQRVTREYLHDLGNLAKRFIASGMLPADLVQVPLNPKFRDAALTMARRMAVGVTKVNARTWREAARRSMMGRRIYEALRTEMTGPVGIVVQSIIDDNARLIQSLPLTLAQQTTSFIAQQQRAGLRAKAIHEELASRLLELTRSRIRLIARTEVSKAQTAVTEARAQRLNLDWYEWETSKDQRVRPSHRKLDKVLVNWNDPPSPEALVEMKSTLGKYHAGNSPNCRCIALPLVTLDEVYWPHKVYRQGRIEYMTLNQFLRIYRLPQAA